MNNDNTARHAWFSTAIQLSLAGGTAAAIGKTVTAPLERVRIVRQATRGESGSSLAILTRIFKVEGWQGLWRGHAVNLSRVIPSYAVRLSVFGTLSDARSPFFVNPFLAGSLSGLASSLVSYPLDVLRTRMSMGNTLLESFRVRCLFSGCFLTVIETMPYAGLSLGTYAYLTSDLQVPKVLAGLSAGAVATLTCFPLDTLKRCKIVHPEISTVSLGKQLWEFGGPSRFYRGLSVALLKAPPTVALTMIANDYLISLL